MDEGIVSGWVTARSARWFPVAIRHRGLWLGSNSLRSPFNSLSRIKAFGYFSVRLPLRSRSLEAPSHSAPLTGICSCGRLVGLLRPYVPASRRGASEASEQKPTKSNLSRIATGEREQHHPTGVPRCLWP